MSDASTLMDDSIRIGKGTLGRVIWIRLGAGADLIKSVTKVAEEEGITSGIIISGVASLRKAVLRLPLSFPKEFPMTDDQRTSVEYEGAPMEVLSITGNITRQGDKPSVHLHATITAGKEQGKAFGGHVVEGCVVYNLAEIAIAEVEGFEAVRKMDPFTKGMETYFENK